MDDILTFERKDENDLYAILGCDRSSSVEQILTEYRLRARELHPDKTTDGTSSNERFQQLQMAKAILTDPHQKRQYDNWLNSGIAIPFKTWMENKDSLEMTMHWTKPRRSAEAIEDSTAPSQLSSQNWSRHDSEMARKFRSYAI